MWPDGLRRGEDVVVRSDGQVRREFDAAYPSLVSAAVNAAQKFFRFNASQVEDVVAETMARAYEHWERVRRHPNPIGWVVVCAKNVCLEQLRKDARRSASWAARNDTDLFVDLSDETAVSVTIAQSLKRLSRRQRDVIVLRYLMDYDEQTTAAVMGTSVSNVRAAAHEARQRLNPLLANVYGAMDEVRP